MTDIKKYLKQQIINNNSSFIKSNEKFSEIYDLLERTIQQGESNSALLIGPRESGKTTLVNCVLDKLNKQKYFKNDAILVSLNGLIHTNDRLALSSINSQMNLDNVIDGKVFGSFAENLSFLLTCLKSGEKSQSKSVLFILDEFDLFCSHHNQTLIYNLFDISQSPQTPICVLGITSRLDVIELLEKRVKSRFSHRQIFLFSGNYNNDISNEKYYIQRVENYLKINTSTKEVRSPLKKIWNQHIQEFIKNDEFIKFINKYLDYDLSEKVLKDILISVIIELDENVPQLNVKMFENKLNILLEDDIVRILQDLSVLELCLIIAMKHHFEIYEQDIMNFEMIYTRYCKFAISNSNILTTSRNVVIKAFEKIMHLELISLINSDSSSVQKEYQMFKFLVLPAQVSYAINKMPKKNKLPTDVIQWAKKPF